MHSSPRKSSGPSDDFLDELDGQNQETNNAAEPEQRTQEHILLLDLDETLVRSSKQKPTITGYGESRPVTFTENGEEIQMHVIDRPHLTDFITELAKQYKIYIYTASILEYAEAVVKSSEYSRLISGIYSRKDCKKTGENSFEKDVFAFGFDEKKLIFIDDWKSHTTHAPNNSINIKFFNGRQTDRELLKLKDFLVDLSKEVDVRCVADKYSKYTPKGLDSGVEEPEFKFVREKLITISPALLL